MQDEARELPAARGDQFSRFLGGSPLAVLLRLVLMSVLVGAYKGGLFRPMERDIKLISVWLKNRLK